MTNTSAMRAGTRGGATIDDELGRLAERFEAVARTTFPQAEPRVVFEAPRRPEFGDFASNVAFTMTKAARKPPQEIASAIAAAALADDDVRSIVAEATPLAGFINVRLSAAFWRARLAEILREGSHYGRRAPRGQRISFEFGSANPTGPLVVVQGRTLSVGGTLTNALRFAGYDVFCEWIINDAGSQMQTLGRSVYARYRQFWEPDFPFPEGGYPASYITALAEQLRARDGEHWRATDEREAIEPIALFARDAIVAEQQRTAERFGVTFDLWQSERELHDAGAIERGIGRLRELGLTYERDGALWIRTTDTGDTEDRVLVRSDGRPTYLANDVAYHYEKLLRADHVIDILGPDHHGYIARLAALAAAYNRPGAIEVLIAQQITLKRGEEIVSMSKRAGEIITLEDIIEEIGVDAARFFFVMLSTDQPLTFDLELAKAQSNDNPVYYVQYGHARIASVLARAQERLGADALDHARAAALEPLEHPAEITLIRRLADFPSVVAGVADARAPHRLARYAREIASDFHQFYDACRIIGEDEALSYARLALAIGAKTILASTLGIMGVSAPEKM